MDARVARHYLAAMTRRMLLTLIAILTGLSWQGTGVQARALPLAAQVSAVTALATVQQAKASAVAARPLADRAGVRETAGLAEYPADPVIPAPGVLTRIDRAHE